LHSFNTLPRVYFPQSSNSFTKVLLTKPHPPSNNAPFTPSFNPAKKLPCTSFDYTLQAVQNQASARPAPNPGQNKFDKKQII
ncbi:MAG: hypothetical protein K2P87_08945, partial [Lachnospiraceae bacterium]|nr:hypothetical protein [Lachnospiraceae bacterium]